MAAPGTPVAVKIDLEDHSLRLEVWNVMPLDEPQVPGEPATNGERPGHGLAGMRERVSLLSGRLFAGEAEDGFFLVSATLPLDEGKRGFSSDQLPHRRRSGDGAGWFRALLGAQDDITVVGLAGDGAEAVKLARELVPDVVLMDVRMPVMDGLEAARQVLLTPANHERSRVIMLTTFDLDEYVYQALRSGASGFC